MIMIVIVILIVIVIMTMIMIVIIVWYSHDLWVFPQFHISVFVVRPPIYCTKYYLPVTINNRSRAKWFSQPGMSDQLRIFSLLWRWRSGFTGTYTYMGYNRDVRHPHLPPSIAYHVYAQCNYSTIRLPRWLQENINSTTTIAGGNVTEFDSNQEQAYHSFSIWYFQIWNANGMKEPFEFLWCTLAKHYLAAPRDNISDIQSTWPG